MIKNHKNLILTSFLSITTLCFLVANITQAQAYTGEELAKDAKITMIDARSIALKARPGQITDEELEVETGGSGLRYSFDVKSANITYEVGIDAKTAIVLENAPEGKNPD